MIQKVEIVKVFKNDTKKDGTPYIIKNGQNAGQTFTRIGIQTNKTGENTYYNNAKAKDKAVNIEVGQILLLDLYEEDAGEGKTWKNFKFPTKDELAAFALESMN
jgi:hypothetical protein